MAPIQSSFKGILNAVWAEKARSTDVRYGVVDKAQRKSQDRFVSSSDGRAMQADLHAALTIALYALLKSKTDSFNFVTNTSVSC